MPWTSWPAATRRGTSCLPIAPVAPATNTLIINPFVEDFTFTPQDKTAAPAVTPPSTPARESGVAMLQGTAPTCASEPLGSGAVSPEGCPTTQRELCSEAAR